MTTAAAILAAAVVLVGCSPGAAPAGVGAAPLTTGPFTTAPPGGKTALDQPTRSPSSVGRSIATVPPAEAPVLPPTRVEIPSIAIDAAVWAVGVAADDQMELPPDPDVMGWYRFGATPGAAVGAAVLGGHLDSTTYGVGQLARLRDVVVGAEILVTSADGTIGTYRVVDVERFDKADLPVREIFRRDGPSALVLITCGGRYIRGQGYEENLVVTAEPA